MKYKEGQFIWTKRYKVGEILKETESERMWTYSVDFDYGTKNISLFKDFSNAKQIRLATDKEREFHLKYRNYKRGEDRYLNEVELKALTIGDVILRNRKGFGVVESIKVEENVEYFDIRFDSGATTLMDRKRAQLIRFTLKHDLSNEFWEPIDNSIQVKPTKDDITKLSNDLKKELSESYKQFLMNYPIEFVFFNRKRLMESICDYYIPNKNYDILELWDDFETFDLESLSPIGRDGLGNYYAIDNESFNIYFIEHEGYFDENDKITSLTNKNFKNLAEVISKDTLEFKDFIIKSLMEQSYDLLVDAT